MFALFAQQEAPLFSTEWWLTVGVSLGLIFLIGPGRQLIARRYVRHLEERAEEFAEGTDREKLRQARRRATVAKLLLSTFQIVVWTVVVLVVLTSIGVNLGPLLATAGIAGVALGFGAQTLVRDTLSGFFILAENQYDVGDSVELQTTANPVAGTVEALTLRITSIRSFDGTLNMVPNGNIFVTSYNRTRGWGRAIVDLRLSYDQDIDQVREVLMELFDEVADTPASPVHSAMVRTCSVSSSSRTPRRSSASLPRRSPSKRWESSARPGTDHEPLGPAGGQHRRRSLRSHRTRRQEDDHHDGEDQGVVGVVRGGDPVRRGVRWRSQ